MTYLNLEDKTVLKFDIEKKYYEILQPELLPFSMRDRLVDTEKTKKDDMSEIWFNNQDVISKFFYNRSLSVNREHQSDNIFLYWEKLKKGLSKTEPTLEQIHKRKSKDEDLGYGR
ncbi:hypothetical protein [Treponema pectinovorum]|uniref:hypothetical protein n=1 Tax=Treponema pectinovorum TaxID=164 RepID=UPI0011F2065A|nr:hypothetical protein [Treponema pectinovorum]